MLRQFILQDDHVARARTVTHKMSRIRNDLPWLTPDLKRHCRWKHRLYDKAKKTRKKEQKQQYKEAQKSFQTELKKSHWLYINNILCTSLEEGNSTPINKYVRSKREDQIGVSPLKEDGVPTPHQLKLARLLQNNFAWCSQTIKMIPSVRHAYKAHPTIPQGNLPSEMKELKSSMPGLTLIRQLDLTKSLADGVLNELAHELAPVLCCLFRQSLNVGKLPSTWLTAWITPVFKKGPRCEPENYRPVSLTCVMCKLMEHTISSHTRAHFDQHGILKRAQSWVSC